MGADEAPAAAAAVEDELARMSRIFSSSCAKREGSGEGQGEPAASEPVRAGDDGDGDAPSGIASDANEERCADTLPEVGTARPLVLAAAAEVGSITRSRRASREASGAQHAR